MNILINFYLNSHKNEHKYYLHCVPRIEIDREHELYRINTISSFQTRKHSRNTGRAGLLISLWDDNFVVCYIFFPKVFWSSFSFVVSRRGPISLVTTRGRFLLMGGRNEKRYRKCQVYCVEFFPAVSIWVYKKLITKQDSNCVPLFSPSHPYSCNSRNRECERKKYLPKTITCTA